VTDILSLTRLPQEIRDDCRNNAKCPRQLLIEIARKKQERAMINLYNKYKESGLTTGEIHKGRQTHEAKTELEIVKGAVRNLQSMKTNIAKLELAIMEEQEKTAFISQINQLNQELTDRLNGIILRLDQR